ncbi:MAG: LysR family transcriptional regulator [Pseudomonas sp.]|uniref:LysR family transcriptional regulator n=1 Tax=Pseudomonas sp. TaxID=306 RepID=UPI00339B6B2B
MDLSTLEIFCAVAAELSITRAAARLQRVQSNVTTRIQQLEKELGVVLFLRDGKRLSLTEQGRQFLQYSERLLALAEEARQAMHPGQPMGSLRLGSMESTAASRLPGPLARYHGQWPEVRLEVSSGPSRQLIEGVLGRRLDCALIALPPAVAGEAPALDTGLEGVTVFREELMLLLPAGHPLVQGPDDLRVRTFAGFRQGCSYRAIAQAWSAGGRGEPLQVQEVGSYHAIIACVSAGSCVGLVPRSVLALLPEPAAVSSVTLTEVDTLLVWRQGYSSAAFEAWRSLLLESR